jgi:hypothetical protein
MIEQLSFNNIFSICLLSALILWGLAALPHIFFELSYYAKNGWNLKLDSGRGVWMQNKFLDRFKLLPMGAVKLLLLSNQLAMALVIIIWWSRAFLN